MRIDRRLRRTILLTLLAALVALPGSALAAAPPTILTAGFDAKDQLYATWSLAPGTTFSQVEFATLPVPDPDSPDFFANGQFAGYGTCRRVGCRDQTSYTADYPVERDRRYFVKVTAKEGDETATSAIWVIDETKPLVPGDAEVGDGDSNSPVVGKPFDGASLVPPGVVPSASITLLKAPKTISGFLTRGVGVRVTSSVAFSVETTLYDRGGQGDIIGLRSVGFATGATRTVAARADLKRATLRGRKRSRIRLEVVVTLVDGTLKKASRYFTIRR